MPRCELLEISDLIADFDVATLQRKPVAKWEVMEKLAANGQERASQVVSRIPDRRGVLMEPAVDDLLIRVHCEMQRLSEEFQHGRRVLELLRPMLKVFAQAGRRPPFRIVDIGCGLGFVIRWLAAHQSDLPYEVDLLGVDFNAALVQKAQQLARKESLGCRFEVANAFTLKEPASMYVSTGVLHHFRGEALAGFFRRHDLRETQGFAHFDFQPTVLARPGAWLFHQIRMREPLSQHDGVVSAVRAHHAHDLLKASRKTSFCCGMYGRWIVPLRIPRVFQTIVGLRDHYVASFQEALGARRRRLEPMQ